MYAQEANLIENICEDYSITSLCLSNPLEMVLVTNTRFLEANSALPQRIKRVHYGLRSRLISVVFPTEEGGPPSICAQEGLNTEPATATTHVLDCSKPTIMAVRKPAFLQRQGSAIITRSGSRNLILTSKQSVLLVRM